MPLRRLAAVLTAWCALIAAGPLGARVPDAAARAFERVSEDDLRRYVDTLASDELRGRGIGDAGNRAAEEFACTTLTSGGVKPAAAGGSCFQAVTITRSIPGVRTPLTIHNVLGIVEGRDPEHRDEVVVVGAHLDHEGVDEEGRIFNGADDNASGTAAVLAAAVAFARAADAGERPARAVVFALWNGEEKGSLGAQAFVASPQPRRRVIANINLDMVGRHEEIPEGDNPRLAGFAKVDPSTSANTLHVLGYSYSPELAAQLRDANEGVGLTLLEDFDDGAQDLVKRSDNWAFIERGIPALFLTSGLHPDYHTPDDDAARIDFGKLARVARLAARAAWIVADGPAPALKKR
jgi:hypothetical protein